MSTGGGGGAATVEYEHVTKRYSGTGATASTAVDDLSLVVPAGRICVLVGPSGCGKTTSLKMVNRLVEPTSGAIRLDGVDVRTKDVTQLRRGIGYVIQQTGLFPHQTIEENVATVPRLLGWPARRRRERASELLATVGLDPAAYASRYPAQLSGGERQRVGVARALAADPPVMLMDEPFGAVDPIVRRRLQNEFLRLQESIAKTILFVTHDIDEAIKMGDLVAVMQTGGRLAQYASPAELLARPASPFVARFVGTDRGLKRLSLFRISDVPFREPVSASVGDDVATLRRRLAGDEIGWALLLDADRRPLGWLSPGELPASGAVGADDATPAGPLLDARTTMKDALSLLLDSDVQAAVVIDREGRCAGIVTVEDILGWVRSSVEETAVVG